MFAPLVANAKARTAPSSTNGLVRRHLGNGRGDGERGVDPSRLTVRAAAAGMSWDFARIAIYPAERTCGAEPWSAAAASAQHLPGPIQAKLTVGAVDDPFEREADHIAEQVMRMPTPEGSSASVGPQISRKWVACEAEQGKLQKQPADSSEAGLGEVTTIAHDVLRAPGQPLDPAARAYFEPRFARDFSQVRVHTDRQAAASAEAVRAQAYTVGNAIVFAGGRFSPATDEGRRLLAHELAHVEQQRGRQSAFGAPASGHLARQPAKSPPLDPNKDVTTIDPGGKIMAGKVDSATGKGVWRVPVFGLQKDKTGWAVVLIPNIGGPAASDKDVPVDVLLHLHGRGVGYSQLKPGEQDYGKVLQPGQLRDVDLYEAEQQLLSHVETTKRFIIAVLPQGTESASFGDLSSDAGAYLNDVFKRLAPKYLPDHAVPGHVTVSGHSGAGPTTRAIAEQRTKAGKQTDVLLFDAINSACAERDPVTKKCKEGSACTSNEYGTVRDWVIDRVHADAKSLPAAADQKSWLKTNGTRFRGFTSESLSTKNTCSYGFWYNKLKNDISAAIGKLSVPARTSKPSLA